MYIFQIESNSDCNNVKVELKWTKPKVLYLLFVNGNWQIGKQSFKLMVHLSLSKKNQIELYWNVKGCKWVFMNWESCNGGPLLIPLWQLPFTVMPNECCTLI